MVKIFTKFGAKKDIQTDPQSPVPWIEPGREQLRVCGWMTDQMGSKWLATGLIGKLRS